MYWNPAVLAGFVFVYSVLAARLERASVGGAIAYTAFGMLSATPGLGILQLDVDTEGLRLLAELTLALVLFADAANADLGVSPRGCPGLASRKLRFPIDARSKAGESGSPVIG